VVRKFWVTVRRMGVILIEMQIVILGYTQSKCFNLKLIYKKFEDVMIYFYF